MTNPPSISVDKDSFDGYNYNDKQMGAVINSPFNNLHLMSILTLI